MATTIYTDAKLSGQRRVTEAIDVLCKPAHGPGTDFDTWSSIQTSRHILAQVVATHPFFGVTSQHQVRMQLMWASPNQSLLVGNSLADYIQCTNMRGRLQCTTYNIYI